MREREEEWFDVAELVVKGACTWIFESGGAMVDVISHAVGAEEEAAAVTKKDGVEQIWGEEAW